MVSLQGDPERLRGALHRRQRAHRAPLPRQRAGQAARDPRRVRSPARPGHRRGRLPRPPPGRGERPLPCRHERHLRKRPIVVTTNKPTASWGRVLHDPDLAEAILDRLLERGHRTDLLGPSWRTRHLEADPRSRRRSLLEDESPNEPGRSEPARISGIDRTEFAEPTAVRRPAFSAL